VRIGEHREELAGRVRVLARVGGGLLAAIAAAYFFHQVVRGAAYLELAENNRLRRLNIEAPRGTIYDRHGRVLVENLPSYSLSIDRTRARDLAASLEFAARALGRPVSEMREVLERPGATRLQSTLLAESLSLPEVARFRVAQLEHPEFEVEVTQRRFYRLGAYAAHVLGYLGEVQLEEVKAEPAVYRPGDWIGRRGIERVHDRTLRGERGERVVVVDSRGFPVEEFRRSLGKPGTSLELTLDAGLQQEAEHQMADKVGAVVALDPRDGAVRALVSAPAYDPNLFARKLAAAEWKALIEDPRHPLQNRALQSAYSPGSVFKIVLATAGLAEGVITPSHTEGCPGYGYYYGRRFHCWKKGGHGRLDLEGALMHSCDVYFYALGQRLGIERIAKHARAFGLGSRTGIDLEGERRGLVPDEAWSQAARKHPWYPGETISVAIGQGALLTTPVQMATMMAAVANGGRLVTPYLVAGRAPAAGAGERRLPLPPGLLEPVRRGLWRVVNEPGGTGGNSRVAGADVAGKTGTVQVTSQEAYSDTSQVAWELRNHAWFASYAPAFAPELVVVVFVEHGGMGSRAAAPIAKALYERYFGSLSDGVTAAS
jgi:penicillin-binding protein 2